VFNTENPAQQHFSKPQIQERAPKRPFSPINKSQQSVLLLSNMPTYDRDRHQCQQQLRTI